MPHPTFTTGALVGAALLTGSAFAGDVDPIANNSKQASNLVQAFVSQLQGELKGALQDGGPAAAVEICKERAPAIAESLSKKSGWTIGRTSLKTRNAKLNSPDDWERNVLQQFDERAGAGADPKTLSYAEVVDDQSGQTFRFMKAIPTADVCLACHGNNINPDVTAALAESYPDDQATGYETGQIRGAFSLKKSL